MYIHNYLYVYKGWRHVTVSDSCYYLVVKSRVDGRSGKVYGKRLVSLFLKNPLTD